MSRYTISTWIVHHQPVDDALRRLSDVGFRSVELSGSDSPLLEALEGDAAGLAQRLEASGLSADAIHSPEGGRQLDSLDDEIRERSLQVNDQYVGLAKQCGAGVLVVHPTGGRSIAGDEDRDEWKARSVASIRRLAEYAAPSGVRIAVENLTAKTRKRDRPGATCSELREMIEGLGEHVGICLDVGHAVISGFGLVQEIHDAGDSLMALHLHDVDTNGRDHFVPGEGVIDWEPVFYALQAVRFDGVSTLEVSPPEENVEERLRAVAAVREAWDARWSGGK